MREMELKARGKRDRDISVEYRLQVLAILQEDADIGRRREKGNDQIASLFAPLHPSSIG
jgi:hypothetical protein